MLSMHDKKQILSLVFVVILLGGAGFYIYTDAKKRSGEVLQTPVATSTDSNSEPEYTITQIPVENPAVSAQVPSLDRPIVFTTDLSPEAKKIITDNTKRLVGVLKADNSRFDAWLDLGSYRKQIGDYEGAREAWEYVALLSPSYYVPFNNLGDLYAYFIKDNLKAEENFKKSIEVNPSIVGSYRALYDFYRNVYTEKSNLADDVLLQGLSKNPKSTDLMILLAQYYKEAGDKEKARTYYQKALTEAKTQGNTSLATLIEQELNNL